MLVGWYHLPNNINVPLEAVINPIGQELREARRVWNKGDSGTKFVVLRHKQSRNIATLGSIGGGLGSMGSEGGEGRYD